MGIRYSDEFLISELHRFVKENGRVSTASEMKNKNGYISYQTYVNHFGTWNNALIEAGFELNQYQNHWQDGTEVCSYCGKRANEILGFRQWFYADDVGYCNKCGNSNGIFDYKEGKLNKKSSTAKATISQRVVAKVLNLEMKYDCNCTYGFKHPVDLYHKDKYFYINVKDSALHNSSRQSSRWVFILEQEEIPDTYICLGYDEDRKNILKVWITNAIDDLVFDGKTMKHKKSLTITNIFDSLNKAEPWEVDSEPYNDMLHKMSQKRKDTNGEECFLNNDDLN